MIRSTRKINSNRSSVLLLRVLLIGFIAIFMCGCAPNRMWNEGISIENENYDLAFVEYTERGNLFDRQQMNQVLEHIKDNTKPNGVLAILFVHGWHHNAQKDNQRIDGNIKSFMRALEDVAVMEKGLKGDQARKVNGLYVG